MGKIVNKSVLRLRHWGCAVIAAVGGGYAAASLAGPMTYQGTVVTDINLGGHRYHNAAVTVTFHGDTKDIQPAVDQNGNPIPSQSCPHGLYFFWIAKGTASVSLEFQGKTRSARFLPGQIFVALDECSGGIGFGSFTGPHGLEPAYPLAFTHGTAQDFALYTDSPLSTAANMSGNAWSCIGYPPLEANSGFCTSPDTYPLHTDSGDVFFYMPYTSITADTTLVGDESGTLNRGTLSLRAGKLGD